MTVSTARLEQARLVLYLPDGRPTHAHLAYQEHRRRFRAAQDAYDAAHADARRSTGGLHAWPVTGRPYRSAMNAAYDAWVVAGSKNEVEQALAVVDAATRPPTPDPDPESVPQPQKPTDEPTASPNDAEPISDPEPQEAQKAQEAPEAPEGDNPDPEPDPDPWDPDWWSSSWDPHNPD